MDINNILLIKKEMFKTFQYLKKIKIEIAWVLLHCEASGLFFEIGNVRHMGRGFRVREK